VIGFYGDRVVSLLKANGGQTSALNAAFARSNGELICFLDADDAFEPDKVERVVAAARRAPGAHLIHHQLQMVDERGKAVHRPFPERVPDGDIREAVVRTGGWFPHPVMSGLAFRRSYAERLFPVPEKQHIVERGQSHALPVFVDTYLAGPAAQLAPVAGIPVPLTRYRVHASNLSSAIGATQWAAAEMSLRQYRAEAEMLRAVMREKFGESPPTRMDDHLEYQLLRRIVGEISWGHAIRCVMRSPHLPTMQKMRKALRESIRRGKFRRASRQGSRAFVHSETKLA